MSNFRETFLGLGIVRVWYEEDVVLLFDFKIKRCDGNIVFFTLSFATDWYRSKRKQQGLWNVIAKTPNGMISVGIRSPKTIPDLSSIVDGLIKKTHKIEGMKDINAELVCLKEESKRRVIGGFLIRVHIMRMNKENLNVLI